MGVTFSRRAAPPVDCDNLRLAQIRVVQRIDGSADKTQCPADANGFSYPVPPRVSLRGGGAALAATERR
jgi:hypothetical protein